MNIVKYTKEFSELAGKFDCGNSVINRFLISGDALNENQGITYVMLSDQKDFIIGYYNIEVGRVDLAESVGKGIFYKPMGGTVNINYLAIHTNFQGKKVADAGDKKIYLGDILLNDCEQRILKLREQVGISFITLCSTKEGYHLYHERNGYENFEDDMNSFVNENDKLCFKLYKWLDDVTD